ncbi:hypothetical protein AB0J43_60420, partial [Nonomuraea fuscirosea]
MGLGQPEPAPRELVGGLVFEVPRQPAQRPTGPGQPPGLAVEPPAQLVLTELPGNASSQGERGRIGDRLKPARGAARFRPTQVRRYPAGHRRPPGGRWPEGVARAGEAEAVEEAQDLVLRLVQGDLGEPAGQVGPGFRPVGAQAEVAVHRDGGGEQPPVDPQRARDPGPDELQRVLGRAGELRHDGPYRRQRDPVGLLQVRLAYGTVEQVGGGGGEPALDGGQGGAPESTPAARAV